MEAVSINEGDGTRHYDLSVLTTQTQLPPNDVDVVSISFGPDPKPTLRENRWAGRGVHFYGALVIIAAGVLFGVYERSVLLTSAGMTTDGDESLAGLMAVHINHGQFPTFLWGQPFGGSAETYLVALAQRIFGVSLFSERFFTVVFGGVAALLLWRVATRYTNAFGAAVAGLALWVWPIEAIAWSMQEYLYYTPLMCLGLASVLCAQRFAEKRRYIDVVLFGLFTGLGWWTSPLIGYFTLMAAIALVSVFKPFLRRLPIAVGAFVAGALPWIIFNVNHRGESLTASVGRTAGFVDHLATFFRDGLPVALGLRSWSGGVLLPANPHQMWSVTYAMAGVCGAVAIWSLVRWRLSKTRFPADMILLLAWPVLSSLSPIAPSTKLWIPRYFFLLWPFLALAVGRVAGRKVGAALVLVVLTGVSIFGLSYRLAEQPQWPDTKPLVAVLNQQHVTRFYASYWISFRVIYDTNEKVIGAPPYALSERHEPYLTVVQSAAVPAWVYRKNDPPEAAFISTVKSLGANVTEISAGGYDVFMPDRKLSPDQFPFAAY